MDGDGGSQDPHCWSGGYSLAGGRGAGGGGGGRTVYAVMDTSWIQQYELTFSLLEIQMFHLEIFIDMYMYTG